MARPAPKPFDPKQIKSEAEYAEEALRDAKISAETGKGQINREEDLGDATGRGTPSPRLYLARRRHRPFTSAHIRVGSGCVYDRADVRNICTAIAIRRR